MARQWVQDIIVSNVRSNYGAGTSHHTTSSDILFIEDGRPKIIFNHIRENGHEVVNLVKSMRKLEGRNK